MPLGSNEVIESICVVPSIDVRCWRTGDEGSSGEGSDNSGSKSKEFPAVGFAILSHLYTKGIAIQSVAVSGCTINTAIGLDVRRIFR